MKTTKANALKILYEKEKKYFDLVWLARSRPQDYLRNESVRRSVETIKFNYPEETEALADEDEGDWQHGFNSGMLAGLRYVLTLFEDGKEQADEEFPFLDT